jgi:tetratricopeptide (TPR) repeat protein/predicted Ser/Thr protein kinase
MSPRQTLTALDGLFSNIVQRPEEEDGSRRARDVLAVGGRRASDGSGEIQAALRPAFTWLGLAKDTRGSMFAGDVVADRFVIERPIGSGGMGTVFRAVDRIAGGAVALKVLDIATEAAVERFRREARVLSELSHPGIVRYLEHGETPSREPFIAMEFLEGEDLGKRLTRGGLTVDESLSVARRAAEALAFAHSRGVVHRDVKPSNLFLVGRDPNRIKVLDFGIARPDERSIALTRTGALLGTVGYMAPEQIDGSREVDARADVFALGCVLFECLTGKPAFAAEHFVAVFAKVMAADPPRVNELRPGLGDAIERLVAKMLAKEPERRFADAAAVSVALSSLGHVTGTIASVAPESSTRITTAERRVVTVILGEPQPPKDGATLAQDRLERDVVRVREVAARFGADAWDLAGGAFVIVPRPGSVATDQAAHAASLALALQTVNHDFRVVLATGARDSTGPVPLGPVIDRAAALLRSTSLTNGASRAVAIDTVTEGLLAARFVVSTTGGLHVLQSERESSEAPRLLLGKATPCVGRDKELGLFELTLREVVNDRVSRAILVTASPGVGKSRLLSEFVSRAQAGGTARIFLARAEAVSSESPLALARQLVRRAAGLQEMESGAGERARLDEYLSGIARNGAASFAEFLAEIAALPASGAPSPMLVAARNDPAIMREQKRRAFEAWMDAETAAGPVLIVLEDLHWGDAPTVNYLIEALRRLADRALMVLAFARPEVHETHPKLFPDLHEVRLGGLAPRAAERLVQAVLGPAADTATVARLVARADGNAFYLEELVRCVAEGDESLPETVLAMVQSRLDRLEPDARRVLRAASAFGETAWAGGVASMLGDPTSKDWLESLSDREVLVRRGDSRFPGEREYVFRHGLLRDAAYAMLTDEDRRAAHRAAGEWLEGAGERDAAVLADHFVRGEVRDRAIQWLVVAARAAFEAGGLEAALTLSTRGMDIGAAGEDRGTLLVILASAKTWSSVDYSRSDQLREALELLPAGSLFWWSAISALIWTAAAIGRPEEAIPYVQLAFTTRPAELSGLYGEAVLGLVTGMFSVGQVALARSFLEQFDPLIASDAALDPVFVAWIDAARCEVSYNLPYEGPFRLESALRWGRQSFATMARAGNSTGEIVALVHLGYTSVILGAYGEAETALTRAIDTARRTGFEFVRPYAEVFLGMLKTRRGRFAEALELVVPLHRSRDTAVAHLALAASAEAYHRQGRLDVALRDAQAAADGPAPRARRWAGGLVAEIALAEGRAEDALVAVDRALGESMLLSPEGERALLVARAEALRALGQGEAALSAIRQAADLVRTIAADIEDVELRRGYLTNVEGNARAIELANAWSERGIY